MLAKQFGEEYADQCLGALQAADGLVAPAPDVHVSAELRESSKTVQEPQTAVTKPEKRWTHLRKQKEEESARLEASEKELQAASSS